MAKNDTVLIDGIIDERVQSGVPSSNRGEAFEFFAFEQIFKDMDLSSEEISAGSVDGRDDGGIDGFFVFVNGHLLLDCDEFVWPRAGSQIDVWIITCKHQNSFRQAPLDSLSASLSELLDLGKEDEELSGNYSKDVLANRDNLKTSYRKLSARISQFSFNVAYASRGSTGEIGESVRARSDHILSIIDDAFSGCRSTFRFIGTRELLDLYRKIANFSLELQCKEVTASGSTYVVLSSLYSFYQFISDNDTGNLRRYLFDSNVRDFMGLNRVNDDIRNTLENTDSADFWWLNNGITILATAASVTGRILHLEDVQIVNGLQTSESIYRFFSLGGEDPKDRSVLIRAIVSNDDAIRDSIIQATNNQTNVELAALNATDKIQRDIEECLLRKGYFYERRTNYYVNQGQDKSLIIAPIYLASGVVSLVYWAPWVAPKLRSRIMRSSESYDIVFPPDFPLSLWPFMVRFFKMIDAELERIRPGGKPPIERRLKNWRHVTGFLCLAKNLGKFDFGVNEIVSVKISDVSSDDVERIWSEIEDSAVFGENLERTLKRPAFLGLSSDFSKAHGISGFPRLKHVQSPFTSSPALPQVSMKFVDEVDTLLPEQPWKPGMHRQVISALQCTNAQYRAAVEQLINAGRRFAQRDGIVFNSDGGILFVDEERVDPQTLELRGLK